MRFLASGEGHLAFSIGSRDGEGIQSNRLPWHTLWPQKQLPGYAGIDGKMSLQLRVVQKFGMTATGGRKHSLSRRTVGRGAFVQAVGLLEALLVLGFCL